MQKRRMPKAQQMMNKQKQARVSHLYRKRKSIWYALLEKDEAAWQLCCQLSWDGMARRHKQKQ
jgi:hypothetical protein